MTAHVTRCIVCEEIRAQRHRQCIHLLRRCTSIQEFCTAFDYKDICIYHREENQQHILISEGYNTSVFVSSAFVTEVLPFHLQLLHDRRLQLLQPILNPFSRISLSPSARPALERPVTSKDWYQDPAEKIFFLH